MFDGLTVTYEGLMDLIGQRVRIESGRGSLAAAIRCHSQACGLVAFVYNVHPDEVARAVAQVVT